MRTTTRWHSPLIDIDEVAGRLGVSTRYVRRLVAERRIVYVKVGRLVRFDADVVDAWLAAGVVNAYGGGALPPTKPVQHSADSPKISGADARVASTQRHVKSPPVPVRGGRAGVASVCPG